VSTVCGVVWQPPSSRWKAIRAALERAVKRATAAAATARDGEAAANAVAPPPLAGAELLLGWEWGTSGGQ
jgi:type II secretory pathway component PulM